MVTINSILHPTDFSELSLHALKYAKFLAGELSAKLHCLYVVDDSYQYWFAGEAAALPVGPPIEELVKMGISQLDAFLAKNLSGIECVKAVRSGRPFVEIINYARKESIGLIVLGTHGRTGLKHMLMGSVAEKVVRKSPCPVLTVHPPGHNFEMP